MKTNLLTLALASLSLTASAAALASSPAPIYYSQLSNFRIDGVMPQIETRGQLVINQLDHTVSLSIANGPFCPVGAMCFAGPHAVVEVTLPIVDVARNPNGSRVITALRDLRRADGALQKLVILDNTSVTGPANQSVFIAIQGRFLSQSISRGAGQVINQRIEFIGTTPMMKYPVSGPFGGPVR